MSQKQRIRPRKKEGLLTFDVVLKDGNTPLLEVREKKATISALEEVLETMKRKM